MTTQLSTNENIVLHAIFAKVDKTAFAVASGLIFFLGMFVITAILINKGATPYNSIGPNLQSLSHYLPGYSLSWLGNLIGSIYMGIIGAIIGLLFACLWNLLHYLYLAILINRINFLNDNWD